jgi:hypothetical protein
LFSTFGQANTQYDFSAGNIDQLRAKAQELEKAQAASKKNLNPKAIAMIEQYAFFPSFLLTFYLLMSLMLGWKSEKRVYKRCWLRL